MSRFFENTLSSAKEIIPLLKERSNNLFTRHSIGAGGDVSLGADLACEEIFCQYLLGIANIDSEESGHIKSRTKSKSTIILDPLDGSDNYLCNIPYYGASLALCDKNGAVQEAAIINFCSGEMFYENLNAQNLNAKGCIKIDIFNRHSLPLADASKSKCGIFEKSYSSPKLAKKLFKSRIKFRSLGASALSMAYALENKFFLFSGRIRKYDAKAGLFLCRNLELYYKKDVLLISGDKKVFGMIKQILKN